VNCPLYIFTQNTLPFAESGVNQIRCVHLANGSVGLIAGIGAADFESEIVGNRLREFRLLLIRKRHSSI
jgi:hypothetical protein